MKIYNLLRKKLSRNLTIILIPHSASKSIKINFTLSFLLFLLICWTGFTLWAGYINFKHIDYWRTKVSHELIKMKLMFFANRVRETQEYIDQIRQKDEYLRQLLDMKTKKAIITQDGKGGPNVEDRIFLEKILTGKIDELSFKDINYQINLIQDATNKIAESVKEINNYIENQRYLYCCTPNLWPTEGRITSPFGFRHHPITGEYEFHTGIDIANRKGTYIRATCDGIVKYVGWASGYGKLVIISNEFYETYYGHLDKPLVKQGQNVKRGKIIGLMGDTGSTTGYHLHYEVHYKDKLMSPKYFLDKDNFFKRAG
jgi:murein DD-endopeptidase MepM/ murein hydrolase activator NlpD